MSNAPRRERPKQSNKNKNTQLVSQTGANSKKTQKTPPCHALNLCSLDIITVVGDVEGSGSVSTKSLSSCRLANRIESLDAGGKSKCIETINTHKAVDATLEEC
jgi:hypothetical protein